ncbi:MAG: hypothetical protein NUV31_02330 [Dehalococcoidales bacterium]|nr:hypothetical protein [Dehalococcoidales bacterium]
MSRKHKANSNKAKTTAGNKTLAESKVSSKSQSSRSPERRKLNWRFIIILLIWLVALVISLIFLAKRY